VTIRVKVLYFGQTRDISGSGEEEFSLPDRSTVGSLLEVASSKHGRLAKMKGATQVALNEEMADGEERLKDGDVVALIPPVAGG